MTPDRTKSDKESWLIKHGYLSTDSGGKKIDVRWKSQGGSRTFSARESTYFGGINAVYNQVKERLWFYSGIILDKKP